MRADPAPRPPAVAGTFYPSSPERLGALVKSLFDDAASRAAPGRDGGGSAALPAVRPIGILVPHAALVYSGVTAARAWATLQAAEAPEPRATVVILGTNHGAGWLDGVGVWPSGAWATPAGDVSVDDDLSGAVLDLGPPFEADPAAHLGEHSIEVQLPLLRWVEPSARIVPLAVSCGTGPPAIEAGERLGKRLSEARAGGTAVVLAISSDMAHYPPAAACSAVTGRLLGPIAALDPRGLAELEAAVRYEGVPGLLCGMCGIEPAVLGLAALRSMGATRGVSLAASTSADQGGEARRTVGYLSTRFDD